MKKAILYLCFTLPFFGYGQEEIKPITPDEKEAAQEIFNFAMVEKKPTYPGCEAFEGNEEEKFTCFNEGLVNHIKQNFKYPKKAKKKGIQGTVYLNFVIEKDGTISNVKVVRGVDPLLDKEAIRVIKKLPNMQPAMQKGKPVRMQYTVPIKAKLGK